MGAAQVAGFVGDQLVRVNQRDTFDLVFCLCYYVCVCVCHGLQVTYTGNP